LVEHISFESEELYKENVVTIKENYFPKTTAKLNVLAEEVGINENGKVVEVPAYMKHYMDAISKL